MSDLPARASFEQLQKQAKELLRRHRAGEKTALENIESPTLADAQFALAREYGFDNWAKLKHHFGIEPYERLANELAEASLTGDPMAVRELNWKHGTSFACDFHTREEMERSFPRNAERAVENAQAMVARSYGFESWLKFADSLQQRSPLYRIQEDRLEVRGPQTDSDWDRIVEEMKERRLTKLSAGGITNAGMKRIARLDQITHLHVADSSALTDEGAKYIRQMPRLRDLELGGWKSPITDAGFESLRYLTELRRFHSCWTQGISDKGAANLRGCEHLEEVNLMGTPAGDGAIEALAGKRNLHHFHTGRGVTDEGLKLLHLLPVFKTWQGGEIKLDFMADQTAPNRLLIDGPFTDAGLASLVGLDGLFGLMFFWHCPAFTSAGLEPLQHLPYLGYLGCQGEHCDDEAMRHISTMPRLQSLMAQGTVASDAGFEALCRSQSLEYLWGRECPNLTGRGFSAMAAMPALRGIAVSCKNVDDASLSALPSFPSLRGFMPMDVPDEGFRHIGRCENLEMLSCMYCRETGDAATEHIANLARLKTYYAGMTQITDRSLEILERMSSLEKLEFWQCTGLTDAGVAHLAALPRLTEITLEGLSKVTRKVVSLFPGKVRVHYSG